MEEEDEEKERRSNNKGAERDAGLVRPVTGRKCSRNMERCSKRPQFSESRNSNHMLNSIGTVASKGANLALHKQALAIMDFAPQCHRVSKH